jgi:hypothetical protein
MLHIDATVCAVHTSRPGGASGELDPLIVWRGSWDRASEAAAALMGRRVRGKAVLEVAA